MNQNDPVTRSEFSRVERRITTFKQECDEAMNKQSERLVVICASVERIEAQTKRTADLVQAWDNTKALLNGISLVSNFIKRTWMFWLFFIGIWYWFRTGQFPTDWFKGK